MSIVDKIKNNLMTPHETRYLKNRDKPIVKNTILLEGSHGREVSGHILAIAETLEKNFSKYEFYIAVRNKNKFKNHPLFGHFVEHMNNDYLELLATSEVLINDTSFWSFFHKRKDQKYYIFWHGTPLKKLGKSTQAQGYGNVQRNLASADKIFVGNEFTKSKIIQDFGIEGIVHNEIVVAPSPRNSLLFEDQVIKGRFLYMPTWRGTDVGKADVSLKLIHHLKEIDEALTNDEEMFIKLHPYEASSFNFEEQHFHHLKLYPEKEDIYHFLQTVEKIITDYSSIMFDFALTGRPIYLFTFDELDYQKDRGFYFSLESLPFDKSKSVGHLLDQIRTDKINDYKKLNKQYNFFDQMDGTKIVLDYLLNSQSSELIQSYNNWNGKENVLIYAYQLEDNGITASLINLLNHVDLSRRNYILIWQENQIPKGLEYKIRNLPNEMYTFIQTGKVQSKVNENIQTVLYMNQKRAKKEVISEMYQRDFDRLFPNLHVSAFIHYPGYDRSYASWMWALKPLGIKTMIFVHTDMEKEFKINRGLKPTVLFDAYKEADWVICVTRTVEKKILDLVPSANTQVMNVIMDSERIQELSKQSFEDQIPKRLKEDFNDKQITVFIGLGRFSKQKGFDRLIVAFEQLNDPNTRLVLIASYGPEKQQIMQQVKNSPLKKYIYLFERLDNPYNLLKAADAFVFSSRYEGLGMVVFEALAVNTPVIMTDIPETIEVLGDKKKAIVVGNSTKGIEDGLREFLKKESQTDSFFDFDFMTKSSLNNWEKLF